jgi:hypothetical protein
MRNKQSCIANEDRIKKQQNKAAYQMIVEEYLHGTHKKLTLGVTDVTNDRVHADIKRWHHFTKAVGHLMVYNDLDPKEELHIYLYGKTDKKTADQIVEILINEKYVVHTFKHNAHSVTIHATTLVLMCLKRLLSEKSRPCERDP